MNRRLTGNGMRNIAAGAALAVGAMMAVPMAAAPTETGQSNPIPHAHIYPDIAVAKTDIQAAFRAAFLTMAAFTTAGFFLALTNPLRRI